MKDNTKNSKKQAERKHPNQLAALRQRAGLQQEQVAAAVWVSRKTYSNWELGNNNIPLATLPILCRTLNCTYDELTGVTPVELAKKPASPLKEARTWAGQTQNKLARQAGMPPSIYRKIEQGRQKPTVEQAISIAEALGIEVPPKFKELWATPQEPEQDVQIALKI